MVCYHRMQSGLPVFGVGEFGAFEIFMQNDSFAKRDFSYFSNWKRKNRSYLDRIWSYLPIY